jgi:hypothetical protein
MEKQFLFTDEEIISYTKNSSVVLTNKRLQQTNSSFGKSLTTSIHLKNISSIELKRRSFPWLLIIGGIFLLIALLASIQAYNPYPFMAGILVASCFLIVYFITAFKEMIVSSNGGSKIRIGINGIKMEDALSFMNKVETAKNTVN